MNLKYLNLNPYNYLLNTVITNTYNVMIDKPIKQ